MTKRDKIQFLLVSQLLEEGHVQLRLPDGMLLEIGITQEGECGDLVKCDNYCWVIASQKNRNIAIDSYNLGLRFLDDKSRIVLEDETTDDEGQPVRAVSVV